MGRSSNNSAERKSHITTKEDADYGTVTVVNTMNDLDAVSEINVVSNNGAVTGKNSKEDGPPNPETTPPDFSDDEDENPSATALNK